MDRRPNVEARLFQLTSFQDQGFCRLRAPFEGARAWLAEQIAEQGLYKDVPFWIDLVQAQAYSEYFRSMAEGMLSADFGRGITPQEQLKKFLGIDAERKAGQSRVKRDVVH